MAALSATRLIIAEQEGDCKMWGFWKISDPPHKLVISGVLSLGKSCHCKTER